MVDGVDNTVIPKLEHFRVTTSGNECPGTDFDAAVSLDKASETCLYGTKNLSNAALVPVAVVVPTRVNKARLKATTKNCAVTSC